VIQSSVLSCLQEPFFSNNAGCSLRGYMSIPCLSSSVFVSLPYLLLILQFFRKTFSKLQKWFSMSLLTLCVTSWKSTRFQQDLQTFQTKLDLPCIESLFFKFTSLGSCELFFFWRFDFFFVSVLQYQTTDQYNHRRRDQFVWDNSKSTGILMSITIPQLCSCGTRLSLLCQLACLIQNQFLMDHPIFSAEVDYKFMIFFAPVLWHTTS